MEEIERLNLCARCGTIITSFPISSNVYMYMCLNCAAFYNIIKGCNLCCMNNYYIDAGNHSNGSYFLCSNKYCPEYRLSDDGLLSHYDIKIDLENDKLYFNQYKYNIKLADNVRNFLSRIYRRLSERS